MVATRAERRSAVEAGLRIQRLEYFTLPVRDLEVARRFYCDVVGGTELEDTGRPETLKIKLFESDVLLYLVEQNAGQPRTDDTNPHFAFEITEPSAFEAFQDRLHAYAIPVLGPMTGMQIPAPPAGTLVHAQIYFDDPDGNHLEVDCNVFPFVEGMPMKPFGEQPYDPWKLFYSWREWSVKYVFGAAAPRLAVSPAPRLVGLNHYTLPVRDLARAKLFYTDVLGGVAIPTFAEAYQVEHGLPVTRIAGLCSALCGRAGSDRTGRAGGGLAAA